MSEENVEIVREAWRAFSERDIEAFVRCFDKDAVMLLPRNLLEGGSYTGHEGIRRAFADVYEMWDEIRLKEESVRTTDDTVLMLGRQTTVPKGDATPTVEFESAVLLRVRRGKIVYFRPFQSHDEALEAAGLEE